MAQIFGFDEIEKIRSMPYNRFFGEMGITKKQKQERIEFSKKIEDDMRFLILLILIMKETGRVDAKKAAEQFEAKLLKWISQYIDLNSETKVYISDFCLSTAQVTADHVNEKYYVSEDRTTIPINNYFLVGKALMRYPHDMAVAFTNPEEVINCRCWVTYS